MDTYEVIKKLIGQTMPTGIHEVDKGRLNNLRELIDVTAQALIEINEVRIKSAGQPQKSVMDIHDCADNFLKSIENQF